jgi:hypothetical protein
MRRAQGHDQAGPVAAGSTFGLARCSHRRLVYRALNPRAGRLWPRSILTALLHGKNEVSSPLSTHAPRSFTFLIGKYACTQMRPDRTKALSSSVNRGNGSSPSLGASSLADFLALPSDNPTSWI